MLLLSLRSPLVLRQIDGLPPSARALAASRAAEGGAEGATAEAGPWKLGLDMPSYLPSLKFIKERSVREKLYRAYVARAGEVNEPLIREILELKQKQVRDQHRRMNSRSSTEPPIRPPYPRRACRRRSFSASAATPTCRWSARWRARWTRSTS